MAGAVVAAVRRADHGGVGALGMERRGNRHFRALAGEGHPEEKAEVVVGAPGVEEGAAVAVAEEVPAVAVGEGEGEGERGGADVLEAALEIGVVEEA